MLSYNSSSTYANSRWWLGMSQPVVTMIIVMQFLAAVGFCIMIVSWFLYPPAGGIFDHDSRGHKRHGVMDARHTRATQRAPSGYIRKVYCNWPARKKIICTISRILYFSGHTPAKHGPVCGYGAIGKRPIVGPRKKLGAELRK